MNLDEQLRATLSLEAELQNAPPADVHRLIRGGRVRRRRRTLARLGIGALAAVLVGGTAYGFTQIEPGNRRTAPGIADQTTEPPELAPTRSALQDTSRRPVTPGTYRMFVGVGADGERIEADMTVAGTGWTSGDDPVVFEGDHAAGVGIYRPEAVASASGCDGDWQGRAAARTPQGLARQLAQLPWGTVVEPAVPTEAFGRDAVHLKLRINDSCPAGQVYNVVYAALGDRGISYTHSAAPTDVVIEFWLVDLEGTTVVVDRWHDIDAPQRLVALISRARDSISFVTTE